MLWSSMRFRNRVGKIFFSVTLVGSFFLGMVTSYRHKNCGFVVLSAVYTKTVDIHFILRYYYSKKNGVSQDKDNNFGGVIL